MMVFQVYPSENPLLIYSLDRTEINNPVVSGGTFSTTKEAGDFDMIANSGTRPPDSQYLYYSDRFNMKNGRFW